MTIDSLTDFADARARLRTAFAQLGDLLDEGALVADEETAMSLGGQKQALEDALVRLDAGRFHVGVVGQMNSGKSTFLNGLLFGREVMSASATPHTAKLTEIRYGPKPEAVVHFFSASEWDSVLTSKDDQVARAARATPTTGADGASLLGQSMTLDLRDLENMDLVLRPYVAVGREGEASYTPLVRDIELVYPLPPWAADTVWLDTPGTNDPVAARSKVTLDKLGDLDAVLVVLYALAPLSRDDLKLLAEELLPTGLPDLFVLVNKIDALTDPSLVADVGKYVRKTLLKEAEALPENLRALLGRAPVYGVSGMAALLARSGGKIREGEFYTNMLSETYGAPERFEQASGLLGLEGDLGRFLATKKGVGLLVGATDRAVGVAEAAEGRLTALAGRLRDQSKNLETDRRELEKDIQALDAEKERLTRQKDNILAEVGKTMQRSLKELAMDVGEVITEERGKFIAKADQLLGSIGPFGAQKTQADIRIQLGYSSITSGDRVRKVIFEQMTRFEREINDTIREQTGRLSSEASHAISRIRWDQIDFALPSSLRLDVKGWLFAANELRSSYSTAVNEWREATERAVRSFDQAVQDQTTTAIAEAMDRVIGDIDNVITDKEEAIQSQDGGLEEVAQKQRLLNKQRHAVEGAAAKLRAERDRLVATPPTSPLSQQTA